MKTRSGWLVILTLTLSTAIHAQSYLALDFGISSTKPTLGASYQAGKNEFTAGLKMFGWASSGEYSLSPGIGYNRYFTENGWYGSLAYAPEYRVEDVGTVSGTSTLSVERQKGWRAGNLSVGIGKQFQWTSWGLNLDGSVLSPANKNLGTDWAYWIGIGGSYRFKLD